MLMHRRTRFGLVGIFALLLGLLPTPVLSSFFKSECGMPCCEEKPAVTSCCAGLEEKGYAANPEASKCPCEIAPAPAGDHHGLVATKVETPTHGLAVLASVPTWNVSITVSEAHLPSTGLRGPPLAALRASPLNRAPPFSSIA